MPAHSGLVVLASTLVLASGVVCTPSRSARPVDAPQDAEEPIQSRVDVLPTGERILVEEILIDAPLAEVWRAYTTEEGYTAWAAPKARIDLRVGGTILTQYGADAEIGDPGTNTLHIVNYVPERVLTLRAEIADNWPEVMKQDGDRLTNVILFDALSPTRTRVESFGIGYGDSPEYEELLEFFLTANRSLYVELKRHLE
ncbi:MAG TPA: SRPBCC domain-containing protein [Planctomycetes bacterium]|nr:SRPBCC domain-containing protein [Planctomycetota bacterium]